MTDNGLLRIADVARETQLSRATIHREIKAHRLQVFRFGRAVRIDRSDLQEWQLKYRDSSRKAAA